MKQSLIEVIRGDITKLNVDVIVNAANSSLMGGGGVDGAIHRSGGPSILAECRKIIAQTGSCEPGEAVITTGGMLPSKYVIHTVGPIWRGGDNNESTFLANCYKNSLLLARKNHCKTIAFPNISTGVYDYPKGAAAAVALNTIKHFLESDTLFRKVVFVCYDFENFKIYKQKLEENGQ